MVRDTLDRDTLDRETWRSLMRPALRIVDSLNLTGYGDLPFRLGGGTVLMFRFDHRLSKDVDLFVDDVQALSFLSPRLNDVSAHEMRDYQEQANGIKFILPHGDIDFIAAGTVIPDGVCDTLTFEGRTILVDPVSEILAKKVLYRAASFKARDVFDMAAALVLDPQAVATALAATRPAHASLSRRLALLSGLETAALIGDLRLTESGAAYADGMVARVSEAVCRDVEGVRGRR